MSAIAGIRGCPVVSRECGMRVGRWGLRFSASVWLGAKVYFNALIRSRTNEAKRVAKKWFQCRSPSLIQPLCLPRPKKYNKTTFQSSFSVSGVIGKFCFLCFLFMHIAWLLWRFSISLNFARSPVYCCELFTSLARMKSNERRKHKAKKCWVNCAMGVFWNSLLPSLFLWLILIQYEANLFVTKHAIESFVNLFLVVF